MVFFDTCIWIELFGVRTPVTQSEQRRATLASALLQQMINNSEKIVTCKEQLIEIISAIQKIKLKECSKSRKANNQSGVGDLKEFRSVPEYVQTKQLCITVVNDVKHFAKVENCSYSVDEILKRIDLADINDCIYYDYCKDNQIDFYTLDGDFSNLGNYGKVHIIR